MKFVVPDGDGAWQEVTIRDTPDGGVQVDMHSVEDVSGLIEENKRAQSEAPMTLGKGTQSSMKKLGSLSAVMAHELMKKGIYQDDKALRRWFDDLDNYLWRTAVKTRKGGRNAVQSSQNH